MKTKNVHGVQLSDFEEMIFSKWLNNNGIAMNTKTQEERTQIVSSWLADNPNS